MIVMDANYTKLEGARRRYRREYNAALRKADRSQTDAEYEVALEMLDRANARLRQAEAEFPLTRMED